MSSAHTDLVRTGAAAAALVLAVLSRGDALVLAALLVLVAWHPPALSVVPALVASSWRWGSSSLDALAGAQAVLGPAGLVGPTSAAAASWLAGTAILLAVPGRGLASQVGGMGGPGGASGAPNLGRARSSLVDLATGATVAAVVAGPAPGGYLWARVAVGAMAWGGAVGVARLRARVASLGRVLDGAAALAGVGAVVAASRSAPAWTGTVDSSAIGEGVTVAVAAAALVGVGGWALTTMRDRWA